MILVSPIIGYEPGTSRPYYESPTPSRTQTFSPTFDQWQDVPSSIQYWRYFPGSENLAYEPGKNLEVWAGTYESQNQLSLFKVDERGFLAEKFIEGEKIWVDYREFGSPFEVPLNFHLATDEEINAYVIDKKALSDGLLETGLFTAKTNYLVIGDEPAGGSGVVNLKSMLLADEIDSLKKFLTLMPRSMLRDWFMKKVWPSIPGDTAGFMYQTLGEKKPYEDLVWAAFIELFNEANLEHINLEKKEPWAWEQEKLEAYYTSQNQDEIEKLESEITAYGDAALAFDPQAKAIMDQYAMLPKAGDLGLEISRQNAIKELLKQKEYQTAQAIVDAYRYAADTVIGETITLPIPHDIVAADGSAIVQKSEV